MCSFGQIGKVIERFGWPRLIIAFFLVALFASAPLVNVRIDTSLSDVLVRVGMNGILVLAMVPMIQSGCGLNFGLPLGIIAGLVGAVTSMNFSLQGFVGFFCGYFNCNSHSCYLRLFLWLAFKFDKGR